MAVGAEDAGAIDVVEQDELAHYLVLVRRDLGAEDAQRRIAVALGDIAQNLIVGPVLLDDVDHVLEHGRLAHPLGDGPGRLVGSGRPRGFLQKWIPVVVQHPTRHRGQFLFRWDRNERQRPVVLMRVVLVRSLLLEAVGQADPLDVRHGQAATGSVVRDRAGEPPDRDQTEQLRLVGMETEHRDGVLSPVGDVQSVAGGIECHCIGAGSEQFRGTGFGPDRLDHLVRADVDHAERVAAGVGDHHVASVRRGRDRGRMQSDHDLADRTLLVEMDHRDRALAGDVAHGIDSNAGAATCRAGEAVLVRDPAAPVAHIRLAADQNHVVRRNAHRPGPEHLTGVGVDLRQAIGQVQNHVQSLSVAGNRQAGRDFLLPPGGVGGRQADRRHRLDPAVGLDAEHLDVAVDVRQVDPRPVGAEHQAGVTQLARFVGLEDVGGNVVGTSHFAGGQLDALFDLAGLGVDQHQVLRLARRDQQATVRAQRHRLRPHAGQFHLDPGRRENLMDRRDEPLRPGPAHRLLAGRIRGPTGSGQDQHRQKRDERGDRLRSPDRGIHVLLNHRNFPSNRLEFPRRGAARSASTIFPSLSYPNRGRLSR